MILYTNTIGIRIIRRWLVDAKSFSRRPVKKPLILGNRARRFTFKLDHQSINSQAVQKRFEENKVR